MAKVLPCLLITIGVAFMWQSAFVPPPGGRMNMGAIHLSTAAGAMLGGGAARADVESAAKKLADASYPMVKAVDWATTDVLDKYMATVPTTKEFSKAILELSVAMDPTLIKNAVQAHKTAVGAMGPNFVTPLKNHEEVTVALAKLFAAAPKDKIQAVFDATPGVQDLNSAWYAKMPKADADATFSAFKELADVVKASPTKVVTPVDVTAGGPIADAAKKLADTSYPLVKAVDWANTGVLDNFVAKTPATKASITALLDAGLAMDPKLIQSATQAHLKALDAADGSLVTPLSNFEDVTVAVAKLIASAPASKIQAVFDTTPNVQGLNADWFAKMPVADAISSYQAFLDTASVVKAR